MKRILILLCLISQVTFAQTLEEVTTEGATTTKTVEFQNTAAFRIKGNLGSPAYGLLDQTVNSGPVWRFGNADNINGYGNFDIFNESAQIVGLRITGTGNAGIGTGTPSSYYHGGNNKVLEIFNINQVTNSQSHLILSTGSLLAGSVGSISWMSPRTPGNTGVAYIGAIMPHDVTYHASGELVFATADQGIPSVKMRLMANGHLGIGTQTPTHRLHVVGGGGIMATDGPLNAYTSQGVPDPNINDPNTSLLGANGLMSNNGEFYYWRAFWGQSIDLRAGGIPDANRNIFRVRRFDSGSNWTELFRVNENGNVGIGTTHNDPNYKLIVNGTIASHKVKVTQEAWADFVFEDHYILPTLQSVETHIKTHKHLPGIPSAGEIAEKGMDIGDMQQKQMQKIEELTLYVIELNKKLAAQQEVISQLEKALKLPKKQ
ncbi:hypothetical protein [Chitinophaga niabensis]|uniref:Uncharacterized protein n=1 Tax=Chitinophaga niabensis TaxID=536979 RepID=A0A1N6KCX0_9BACT|nr:hypothetical protein [Chitinophaga niabensis]SIO54390.1 hypothetical protein SAMN04488055_5593 [Chitinophaga niabensis]